MPAVYESLAAGLVAEGVEVAFGVIGAGTYQLTQTLVDTPGVRYVAARHEHGAVAMADGYGRITGRVGVALISADAGLTNAMTALSTAQLAGSKTLIIVGDQSTDAKAVQTRLDQVPLERALGVRTIHVSPGTAQRTLARAFDELALGHGPVLLNLPWDVSSAPDIGGAGPSHFRAHPVSLPPPGDDVVDDVIGLIALAKRPLVLAGQGATSPATRDALQRLASRIGALTATTLLAKGLWPGDPFSLGVCGSFATSQEAALLAETDLLLAFGCSLNPHTQGDGAFFAQAKIVQVDTDPAALGRWRPIDVGIVGEAATVAAKLEQAAQVLSSSDLTEFGRHVDGWRTTEVAATIEKIDKWTNVPTVEVGDGFADPHEVMRAVDELTPRNRLVAIDIGYFMSYPAVYLDAGSAPSMICPWEYGAIGCALGPAVGAALGRPDLYPVLVIGDGGLSAVLPELETVVRCQLPMLIVVMDDQGYRAERELFHQRGLAATSADIPSPDFEALGRGFGMDAYTARSGREARQALESLDPSRPSLLRVVLDPRFPNPEMARAMQGM
jgi:thiamine pyrophosphate-dependent acetolactate synthase large subunit-like protein